MIFYGIFHFIESQILNGIIDLRGIKLTENQLEQIREYIAHEQVLRTIFEGFDSEGLIIVNSANDSDLII